MFWAAYFWKLDAGKRERERREKDFRALEEIRRLCETSEGVMGFELSYRRLGGTTCVLVKEPKQHQVQRLYGFGDCISAAISAALLQV